MEKLGDGSQEGMALQIFTTTKIQRAFFAAASASSAVLTFFSSSSSSSSFSASNLLAFPEMPSTYRQEALAPKSLQVGV